MACSPCPFRISWNLSIGVKLLLLISFIFELDICGLSSRYFISCLPFCPVPDCARLCEKYRSTRARMIFQQTTEGPGLAQSSGHGTTFAGGNKTAVSLFLYFQSLFSSPSCCGMRCLSSGSFFILSISSSIICKTSDFICE